MGPGLGEATIVLGHGARGSRESPAAATGEAFGAVESVALRRSAPRVAAMKPAHPWKGDHGGSRTGLRFDRTADGGVFAEREVGSVDLVVGDELREQMLQVPFVQDDDVIGATRKGWSGGRK